MNLNELLTKLNDAENAMQEELTDEQFEELFKSINQKIDSIYNVMTIMDAESDRLKAIEKNFYDQRKKVERNKERLEKWLVYSMKANNMPFILGEKFQVKLVEKDKFTEEEFEITPMLAMKFNAEFPGLVKIAYSLRKKQLEEAYNSNENYKIYGKYVHTVSPKFTLRKDI